MGDQATRWIAGCMTGTSLDGLDVALAQIDGRGLEITARFAGMVGRPLGELREPLLRFATGQAAAPIEYMRAARRLGELHADAVAELCRQHLPHNTTLDFVAAHGQTIWHAPQEHLSWQLFDPWPIAQEVGVPVCYDLRQADLIAGGQGAPITPIADWVIFRHPKRHRLIVNLGGICNTTFLPANCPIEAIRGEDHGPCNLLIDGIVQKLFPGKRYDVDGKIAQSGRSDLHDFGLDETAVFLKFADKTISGNSLGREDFNTDYIDYIVEHAPPELSPQDLVACAVNSAANTVSAAVTEAFCVDMDYPENDAMDVVLAGGGACNPYLVEQIKQVSDPVFDYVRSDDLGIPCQGREAMCFAVLGALCQDGVAITLPQVTKACQSGVAGSWIGLSNPSMTAHHNLQG